MGWTDRQQDAIDSRKETLLVSAAAGSGKTAVLVERVIGLILNDRIGLDRMLIVTFTNAAAAEMKEKIGIRIRKALQDPELSPDNRKFLRSQLSMMGSCNISTFHKFAMEIVRRYYHVIGIPPALAVCDSARQELLKEAAMNELFEDKFACDDADFIYFLDCYADSKSDREARVMIMQLSEFLRSLPEPEKWTEALMNGSLTDVKLFEEMAKNIVLSALEAAAEYLEDAGRLMTYGPGDFGYPPASGLAAKNAVDLAAVKAFAQDADGGDLSLLLQQLAAFKFQVMRSTKQDQPSWDCVKDRAGALRDQAKDRIKKLCSSFAGFSSELLSAEKDALIRPLSVLCRLTAEFDRRYQEKKLAARMMDFGDIEHYALEILKDDQVCSEYRNTFEYAFIDEYQDSNQVQDTLISKVCRPDRLFMVGDVKQSIYKFRLAEPELFIEKYLAMKSKAMDGRVIDLNANFRSKAPVIDFVNQLFSVIMTPESCGMKYDDDAALIEGVPYDGPLQYRPKLYIVDSSKNDSEDENDAGEAEKDTAIRSSEESEGGGGDAEDLDYEIVWLKGAELEALQAVRIIDSYLGKPVFDSKTGENRPLTFKDMVILMPAVKGKGEIFYQALASAGIPAYLERSEGYFDTLEVKVFLDLLRIIDNSRNDLPLIGVLHFPAFGFTVDELSQIRIFANEHDGQERKRSYSSAFRLYAAEAPGGALKDRCAAFLHDLEDWRMQSAFMPLADFLWMLLGKTGILSCCGALSSGAQRQANLKALVDKARVYEEESASGLYGFITYIESIKDKVSVGEAEIFNEDSRAVRIMTIHKSKGLEFPFVLVAGMGRDFSDKGALPGLLLHKKLGAAAVIVNRKTRLSNVPFVYRLLRARQKNEEMAESIRLLYVAATRAKDILIFSGAMRNAGSFWEKLGLLRASDSASPKNYLGMLYPAFASGENVTFVKRSELEEERAEETGRGRFFDELKTGFDLGGEPLSFTDEELGERLAFTVPSGSDAKSKTKYSVSQLAEIQRLGYEPSEDIDYSESFKAPAFAAEAKSLGAAARGTAYHTVMEHIPFTGDGKTAEDITLFMDGLVADGVLTDAERKAVDPQKVAGFFISDIGRRVLASDRVMKEAPFTIKKEYKGRTIMIQGTLDCCFIEDGKWVLVDYKSNYIDRSDEGSELARLHDTYVPQLSEYRYALERITGIPVKEAVLYLFGLGRELICK